MKNSNVCFRVSLTAEMVPKVYTHAYELRVSTVTKACSSFLVEQLTEKNCLVRLLAMDDELRSKAESYISNNFAAILETREFHTLPTIKVELIGLTHVKITVVGELIMDWLLQQLVQDNKTIQELGEYVSGREYESIIDYQTYKLAKRSVSTSSATASTDNSIFEVPSPPQLINFNLLANVNPRLRKPSDVHNETHLIHIEQPTDHSFVAISIVNGKMLIISIHLQHQEQSLTIPSGTEPTSRKYSNEDLSHHQNGNIIADKELMLACLTTPRCGFGIAKTAFSNTIYAIGGYDRGDCLDTVESYNPSEDKWTILLAKMNVRRGRVAAAAVKEKIFVCGGSDGQQELDTAECFDTKTMKWSLIKELNSPVAYGAMCADNNSMYLIGGCEGDLCKNECYKYDPIDNLWSQIAPMRSERSQAAVVYLDGKIFVFGGYTVKCLNTCEVYSIEQNSWSDLPSMKEYRRGAGAVVYRGKIFVVGGCNGPSSLTSVEIFDTKLNEWQIGPELNIPRAGCGVIVCGEQNIFTCGGFDGRTFLKSIEVFEMHKEVPLEIGQWRMKKLLDNVSHPVNGKNELVNDE
ncbi:unnamed protein product [Didymodactylos carnosus]|uniref:Uncharacterized protein n=1 Tax=Didymodactylos carnosus TaxID=1234261 RepID=A0A8S2E7E9_9BILA|nr:unnamed protein product [Didymodactylos carnosus]CAF3858462.1 unnamed protein product [Didymodactylos carnosus]